jgi:probable F420-dependent oxidoreductase
LTENRKFRFSIKIQATSRDELFEQVRQAEDLGYSGLTMADHLSLPRLAPISTLAALAALGSPLRLTSAVFGNDFRNPAMLASEAATIDLISNGRLELGLGTGWWEPDYIQSGIAFDPPGTRVSRLIEAVHIIKGLFSKHPFTFEGQYYSIRELDLMPKAVQHPHPPILIGGGGKRMLTLAAKEADIVSVNPIAKGGTMDLEDFFDRAFAQKITWVGEAAGERIADFELHLGVFGLTVTDDQQQAVAQWIERAKGAFNVPSELNIEDVLASPYVLIGSVDQIIDKLQAIRDQYGVSYFTIPSSSVESFGPVVARLAGN